jgi:hypothetical protein
MINESVARLGFLCETVPPLLLRLEEPAFSTQPAPGKWSKKEILGHLMDSAANNHHRFVRGQFEDMPFITYNPDLWNANSHYQNMEGAQLIEFWKQYNLHLLALIKLIPAQSLQNKVTSTADGKSFTLEFLINDYVAHLEYHLKQLVDY